MPPSSASSAPGNNTYWYISASPELMAQAADRMARAYGTREETS